MPDPRPVTTAAARRFMVLHHLLAPPRSLAPEPDSVLRVVDRLGSLQFDPLAVAGRNHDLVLHARIAGYRVAWTDDLLYRRRALFEAFNKMLSLLPTVELPFYRITWDRTRARLEQDGMFERNREIVDLVLAAIRERGPLGSADFERRQTVRWYWGPTNQVRAVLEALFDSGVLGIHRRAGNIRAFDLVERLFPPELLAHRPLERDQLRHKLFSRYRGHGMLGGGGASELFAGIRPASGDEASLSAAALRAGLRNELVAAGLLVPVAVPGFREPRFILAAELPLLAQAEAEVAADASPDTPGFHPGWRPGRPAGCDAAVSFLAPLDSFMWDRDFVRRAFGFDYVWEVYVPERKRRWGYYVLPILYGDRLVGRIEPRVDRSAAGAVRVLGVWWEQGFEPRLTEGFVPALRAALAAFRDFHGASRIEWGPGLSSAARLVGTLPARPRAARGSGGAAETRAAGP